MLLIIFLGLIAKLAVASADCDFGHLPLNDFDWTKFSGTRIWYYMSHNSNDFENNLECSITTYSSPEGDRSLITTEVYDKSEQRHIMNYGNATNWNSNGCFEVYHPVEMWTGRYCVIAIDYNRFFILKICPSKSNKPSVYVAYRCKNPDEQTVTEVKNDLQDNNLDVSQLVEFSTDYCK